MPGDPRAAGWALKAACYDAWHTEPPRARQAADALQALARTHAETPDGPLLHALAAWTGGIAQLAEGRLPAALAGLQQAQAAFAALADPQHAAETQVPQVVALSMLGRDAEALQCAQAALACFVASGDTRSAGKIELNLGTMLSRQDRHAEAEQHFRRAAVRFARIGDAELSIMADIALANALTWQFHFDAALQMFERARMRAGTRGLRVLLAQAHQGTGRIELHRGRWHAALHELAASTQLLAETGAPPQRRIEAEAALADAYLAVNLAAEAVALYDQVIAGAQALQAPTEHAWALLQRSRAHERLGDAAAARAGYTAARALYAAADNPATLGYIDIARGRLALAAGQPAQALADAARALLALQGSGIVGWQLEARSLQAAALAAAGDAAAAREGFVAALAEAADLPQIELSCRVGLGALAAAAGHGGEARSQLTQALALVERARAALPDDEFRSALAADAEAAHRQLVALSLAEGDAAQLLDDIERGRARALALSLRDTAQAQRDEAALQLQWLRRQWHEAVTAGGDPRLPGLGEQVRQLEHTLLEARRRAHLRDAPPPPGDARWHTGWQAALQQALGPARALAVYQLHGAEVVACVATSQGVATHRWPAADLPERLRGLRFQIDTLRFGGPARARHAAQLQARATAHLQALHRLLWAPLQPLLGGRRHVVLVPHRELHYVPFAALHDGQAWLVQTHCLSQAPSARVWLAQSRRPATAAARVLALGAGGASLPHVAQELAAVAAVFGPAAQCLAEAGAGQAALARHAPQADVLHFACHGRFRADNPAFSHLRLGDGPLTLHDASRLPLRAALVALSACETGISRLAPGDEVLGLVRAFMLAGAARVLATLWPVDDGATAALIARFYAGWRRGGDAAAALQQAQAAAAQDGQHPFFWAAWTLHGAD